ncbi:MAG: hypothetical protein KDD06_08005 [Phaeodactylibacter sp.]|nr:hypothetical protein [Phaeodactylibacter sp.]MCB9264251.1 hypothetical protein [Lewinellaceae bacterium]MCB9291231.1 hypothetical protein [Lewinellaceae bacterium]
MDKSKKRQLQLYLFLVLSVITAILAYTIEAWRWGAIAFTAGFLLIAVITLMAMRSNQEDEEP